jgi:mannitol-1-phosphate 5-dehydrogenase
VPTQTIVIWGAGRIGRGFVADLFDAAGYRIVLVDESEELVERLRQAGRYTVVQAESAEKRTDHVISDFSALTTAQVDEVTAAVAEAGLMAVAVFPKDFPAVVRQLVPCLEIRRKQRPDAPLDTILCANIPHPGEEFGALLQEAMPSEMQEYAAARIGIVDSLVIRMVADPPAEVQQQDPLLVWTNGYAGFPVDHHAFKGDIPQVPGLRLVDDMRAEEARKLYTYNAFHAALAYHGARQGYERIVDCMADSAVRAEAGGALREAGAALQAEYGFASDDMDRWIEGVLAQTNNPTLRDTVGRYGADPRRKLRRADRLVGPTLLARKHGVATPHLIRALAAALLYRNPEDAGATYVQGQIASLGLPDAIRALCELTADEEDLVAAIARAYDRLRAEDHWANLAERASALAFEYEKIYHGCGQCALAAILETLDQFDEAAAATVFEAATGLAGGLGLAGDSTCAALIGGTLAFGMLYPRRSAHFDGDCESKYRTYSMAQRLRQRYLDAYGSILCHEIHRRVLGRAFDLRDPAERKAFEAAGAHDDKCTSVVARAARWAVEIIGEEQLKDAEGK